MSFPHDLWCACRKWMEPIPRSRPYGCEALHCRPACIRPYYRFSCGWTGILYWPGHTVTTAKRKKTWVEIKHHSLSMPLTSKVGWGEGTVKLLYNWILWVQLQFHQQNISGRLHLTLSVPHGHMASMSGKYFQKPFDLPYSSVFFHTHLSISDISRTHVSHLMPILLEPGKSTHWQHVKPNSHENN